MKTLDKAIVKHMQHLDKIIATYVLNICNIQKETHLQCTYQKTDETFRTDACNIHVYPLPHMQYSDLLLQHLYETLATFL